MQAIIPFLWFNKEAQQAAEFYTSVFPQGKVLQTVLGPKGTPAAEGEVMVVWFTVGGLEIAALNGGPEFSINPSISFFVTCGTAQEVDALWAKLIDGGKPLMELGTYPFSKRYGWVQDKFGVTWQLMLADEVHPIKPCLMFTRGMNGKAEEAIKLYTSVFPNSKIGMLNRYAKGEGMPGQEGLIKHGAFTLNGQEFTAMDGGGDVHKFTFNEGVSLAVQCDTQAQIDAVWDPLSAHPEAEVCGWMKDRFGVSWQVNPAMLPKWLSDAKRAERVMAEVMKMKKLDIPTLERAAK